MVVYTSVGSSVHYGFEAVTAFGTPVLTNSNHLTTPKTFGLNTSVNNLTIGTNRIELAQLGQVEPTAYAYGQQAGTCSVGFTYDDTNSQDIFQSIYGAPSGDTSAWIYPSGSTIPAEQGTSPAVINSLTVQVDQELLGVHDYTNGTRNTTATRLRRLLKGCVVTSLGISASVGGTVEGSAEMVFGKEEVATSDSSADTGNNAFVDQVAITGKPLTFAHGSFKLSDGTGLRTLGEIQSVNCSFGTNTNLLYELGSHYSVDAFRQVFDITGSFNTTFKDLQHLHHLLNQASKSVNQDGVSDGTVKSTDIASGTDASVGAELAFTSGNKHITISLSGVTFDSHAIDGLVPVQPVFETLPFKAKAARVVTRTA